MKHIAGKFIDQRFVGLSDGPSKLLLRWHFRQAVLANMRGAGEAALKNDFLPGSDVMGEISSGPIPTKWMEFEFFGRLAGFEDGQACISG